MLINVVMPDCHAHARVSKNIHTTKFLMLRELLSLFIGIYTYVINSKEDDKEAELNSQLLTLISS